MNCREFADFLNLYFDNELSEGERAIFDRHLSLCKDCRAYLNGYRITVGVVRATAQYTDAMEAAPEELILAILAARRG